MVMFGGIVAWVLIVMFAAGMVRAIYSNSTENLKRPTNREDSSDLDENLTESIAAMRSIISKVFGAARAQKSFFQICFCAIAI